MITRQPNILFFFPDQQRADWLGCNPALPLRTPTLDRLCGQGTRFTNAYTPSPLCAPARACLASGLNYEQCRVPSNNESYPLDIPTYYQRLRDVGYHVCGVGKFDLHKDMGKPKAELDWHLDGSRGLKEWGFDEGIDNEGKLDGSGAYRAAGKPKGPYLQFLLESRLADLYAQEHEERKEKRDAYVTALPDDAYCDNWVSENGLRFLRNFPKDKPWHLVINFTGPHNPMDVTESMSQAWEGVKFPPPVNNAQKDFSEEDHQRNRRHYAAMIENIDRQMGRFIDVVKERGELDNTLIVFASDHGEMLGDHGRWGKNRWQDASARIPLIVAGPGVSKGATSDALVSLHDLTATFLEYAGAPPLPKMDSRSLRTTLADSAAKHREHIFCGLIHWRMIYDGRYKLVKGNEWVTKTSPPILLYDMQNDPNECTNIAPENPGERDRLLKALEDELAKSSQAD